MLSAEKRARAAEIAVEARDVYVPAIWTTFVLPDESADVTVVDAPPEPKTPPPPSGTPPSADDDDDDDEEEVPVVWCGKRNVVPAVWCAVVPTEKVNF